MIPRPLHYSQRSSSAVQINYHWCSINGSFQISPRRMPLICTQRLSRVERPATVPLPAICEDEKLPAVLARFPSVGGSPIMIDVNYWAPERISPKLHALHFLCTATGTCAYRWRVERQSGTSVWKCGWQTPTSPPLMERFQLIRHILHLCVRKLQSQKPLPVPWDPPPAPPHIHSPCTGTQTWANFQTHTANILIEHL